VHAATLHALGTGSIGNKTAAEQLLGPPLRPWQASDSQHTASMHHAARHASRTRSKHAGKARGRACGRRSTLATAPTEAAHLSRRLHSRSSCCAPKWSTTCQLLLPQRSCAKPAAEHDEHGHHGARDVATDGCAAHLRRVCTQPKALSRSDAMAARAGSMLAWVVLFTVHAKFVTRGLLRWQAFGEAWQQASAAAQRHWRPGQSSGVMGPPSHVPPTVGEVQRSRPR